MSADGSTSATGRPTPADHSVMAPYILNTKPSRRTSIPSGSSVVAGKIDENGQSSTMDSEVHVGSDRRFLPSVTGVSLHYAQRLGIRVERCYHASDTQWCGCKWVVRCHVGLALTARDRYRLGRRSVIYVFSRMWSWRRWLNVQSGHRKDGSPSGALCRTHGTEKVRCPRHRDSTRGPTRRRRARKGSRPGCACSRMRSLMRSEAGCGAELLRTSTKRRGAQRLQVEPDPTTKTIHEQVEGTVSC